MYQPNSHTRTQSQATKYPMVAATQNSTGMMLVDQKSTQLPATGNVSSSGISQAEHLTFASKKLQDDLAILGRKVKQHEENLSFLTNQKNIIENSILNLPVEPSVKPLSFAPMSGDGKVSEQNEDKIAIEKILQHEKSAAALVYHLSTCHSNQAASFTWTKDVLGVVSTLGRVEDDNLSRLLSEYLGEDTMMAIVCKTYESVKALEEYDAESKIIRTSGLHGAGACNGRPLYGRFLVICLESLSPYTGEFVANDPQKMLDLEKPRLPTGEAPPGFIGYAVNMISIEPKNLIYLTSNGLGLRETLFYHLFSRLQVYKTRSEMLLALPYIRNGAVSLDGGIIKTSGVFSMGNRQETDIVFPKSCGMASMPFEHYEKEIKLREFNWKRDKISEDIRREQSILDHNRAAFESKKQELLQFLAQSQSYINQQQAQMGQERLTPVSR